MRNNLLIALALSTALAASAQAQYAARPAVQTVAPADQLASVMRRLATAPTDLFALISAGELSVKLDDMSAAAAFFARADRIDPRNGRVKAGMASILVRAERPGEALRYFQMAEGFGLPASRFAADRGLALDLLGEQERAQRDYRLALRTTPDDETVRRYALSLGISGKQAQALEQLDPLVRRQDRAGWRVRAFVLAMAGDLAGANKIAATMMPAGMAAGLRPFLERLRTLPPVDRAFAVHFGEVRPTPARLADARMKPVLPSLGPDPYAPVQVAAVQRPAPPPVVSQDRRRVREDRRRDRRDRAEVAAATRAPPRPAVVGRAPTTLASARPVVGQPTRPAAVRPTPSAPTQVASVAPTSLPRALAPAPASNPPRAAPFEQPTRRPGYAVGETGPAFLPSPTASAPSPVRTAPAPEQWAVPSAVPVATSPPRAAPVPAAIAPASGLATTRPVPAPSDAGLAAVAAPVSAVRSEDSILARIVGSITIPGEELGVVAPARKPPTVAAVDPVTERTLAVGQAKAAIETADRAAAARTIAAAAKVKPADVKPAPRATRRARAGAEDDAKDTKPRTAAERREADRKKAADERLAAKKDAPKKDAARKGAGEPERIWVQVAGGANQGDLPKAWNAAQKKAAALKGRQAYTTPLRATNRVVTGPFKTEAEARAFVNQLSKQGVSAFQFTSAAGQKMTKLPGK